MQVPSNIGSGNHQTNGDERKNEKRVPQMKAKASQNQPLQQKSHQRHKQERNQRNESEDKKVDDDAQVLIFKR